VSEWIFARSGSSLPGFGGTYFSPTFEDARRKRHADPQSFDKVLSETEQRLICLIGEGLTNEEIGRKARISPRTVQTHRHNILRKLNISGTLKLIAFAMQRGFTTRNPPLNPGRSGERDEHHDAGSHLVRPG
jgi:DNA-binding NarL/FixJ family response regulator